MTVGQIVRQCVANQTGDPGVLPDGKVTMQGLEFDSLDMVSVEIAMDEALGGFDLNLASFWDRGDDWDLTTVDQLIEIAEAQVKASRP
jgi:hypothetical protein